MSLSSSYDRWTAYAPASPDDQNYTKTFLHALDLDFQPPAYPLGFPGHFGVAAQLQRLGAPQVTQTNALQRLATSVMSYIMLQALEPGAVMVVDGINFEALEHDQDHETCHIEVRPSNNLLFGSWDAIYKASASPFIESEDASCGFGFLGTCSRVLQLGTHHRALFARSLQPHSYAIRLHPSSPYFTKMIGTQTQEETFDVPETDIRQDVIHAVNSITAILSFSRTNVANILGLSPTSIANWTVGTTPRPSRAARVLGLHSLLLSLVRRLGIHKTREWFAAGSPTSRRQRLLAGELEAVQREIERVVFPPRPQPVDGFQVDAAVKVIGERPAVGISPRRAIRVDIAPRDR